MSADARGLAFCSACAVLLAPEPEPLQRKAPPLLWTTFGQEVAPCWPLSAITLTLSRAWPANNR
jgi:hypothetical protein